MIVTTGEVLATLRGRVGRIRLNRPRALHALNLGMCRDMRSALLDWQVDPGVSAVLIDHAEGRGFCAGGDLRALAASGAADGSEAAQFFRTEYQINHLLFSYGKPVIAVMDGVTMGGGAGLVLPARYRIATERTVFAMPEGAIGLFPDVGACWHLARLPGRFGVWLALTGARLDGADCVALGLANAYVPSDRIDEIKARLLAQPDDVETILQPFRQASVSPAPGLRVTIDRLFAADKVEDILAALRAETGPWAEKQQTRLASHSGITSKLSLRLLAQSAKRSDFAEQMRSEYRIATRICRSHDFIEGVRARLVDKDNSPHWKPATPEEVTDAMIGKLMAPLPAGEEWEPATR